MTTLTPVCLNCRNYGSPNRPPACSAYPGGIPREILEGVVIHNRVLPGQQGTWIYEEMTVEEIEERAEREVEEEEEEDDW